MAVTEVQPTQVAFSPAAEADTGTHVEARSAVDGRLLERVASATAEQCASAVAAAIAARDAWARTPAAERAAAVHAVADAVRAAADDLADAQSRQTGKPHADAVAGVLAGADTLRQYAELGPVHRGRSLLGGWSATDLMVPEPRGVVLVLTPWNDPVAVACGLIGAALVTGNTVVHKPSERAVLVGRMLTDLVAAHLPPGVLTHVPGAGDVGARLTAHPAVNLIAHVGGSATGRLIAQAAARTGARALLENGGNDALIVDGDVDPEWAAEQAAIGAFANAGQICTSVERIFVHRAVADDFLAALTAQARRRVPTPNGPDDVEMGPLVDEALRDLVHAHVTDAVDAGATLLTGGQVPAGPGSHYPATVLTDCRPDMLVLREETFGPVAPVCVVDDFDEALRLAGDDRYGLAATVLTGSMANAQRAWRELPVGTVKVNAVFGGAPGGAAQPRAASGDGFGYGPELLDEMTVTKVVHIAVAPGAAR
jgi:acyl-CoA reductase-like NAD-dependent aldehyde dehydrogenase